MSLTAATMFKKFLFASTLLMTLLLTPLPVISSIQVQPDGGYSGIVIKINQDVPEADCADILQKIQVSYMIAYLCRLRCILQITLWIERPNNIPLALLRQAEQRQAEHNHTAAHFSTLPLTRQTHREVERGFNHCVISISNAS